jgi:hypothetical protein
MQNNLPVVTTGLAIRVWDSADNSHYFDLLRSGPNLKNLVNKIRAYFPTTVGRKLVESELNIQFPEVIKEAELIFRAKIGSRHIVTYEQL